MVLHCGRISCESQYGGFAFIHLQKNHMLHKANNAIMLLAKNEITRSCKIHGFCD